MVTTRSQAAKRTCFTSLPLEILQQIFSYFCLHCRERYHPAPEPLVADLRSTIQHPDRPSWYSLERRTLLTLCLVSKHFCHAAQPVLYHEFMPGYGDLWGSNHYTWLGRLTSFMRTVAQRRDLAALVQRIYVDPYLVNVYFLPPRGFKRRIAKEVRDVIQLVALALRMEEPKHLAVNDLVTLLIAELPNLQHCNLQVDRDRDGSIRSAVLRAAGISHLSLKTLDISLHARADHVQLLSLERCARALFEVSTSLETLNVHMCGHMCGHTWNSHRTPLVSLPNLTTLRLTFSRLHENDLEALLSSCSRLQVFIYESAERRRHLQEHHPGFFSIDHSIDDHFHLSSAVKYLGYHRTTLKSIHLDLRWRSYLTPEANEANARGVFTFQEFTQLEHLFLNLDEFHTYFWSGPSHEDPQLLVQLLPPSIVSLHLAGHIKDELPRLERALLNLAKAALSGTFPRLEEVRWDKDVKLSCENAVITMFAAAGVSFCYDKWPTTRSTLGDGDVWPPPNHPNLTIWDLPEESFDI